MAAETVGRADPHGAGQMRTGAADRLLVGDDGRFHRFRAVGDALAGLGQEIAALAAVEQFCGKPMFQPVDTADHRGMIDAELPGGSRHRSAAYDGQYEAEIIPVDRAALIQHFRTSKVQYLGLNPIKCRSKRFVKRPSSGSMRSGRDQEVLMRSIGHFIGGKEVKGTSGRTADVFEPMTGDVQAKVALASS